MENFTLEVCVDSVESAINAERGGATRLELCANLIIGGTTPTENFFKEVRKNVKIPINVLIRPRFGDFLYSDYETEIIKNEIITFRKLGANGVVIGALTKDGNVDIQNMKKFLSESENMKVTFHRAFDVCKNPFETFEKLRELKVDTILTSGQSQNCLAGKEIIKKLVNLSKQSANNPKILVGAGLNRKNIEEIIKYTKANSFHFSAKKIVKSGMMYRKEGINMGIKGLSEFEKFETDEKEVFKMYNYLKNY